MKIRKGNSEDVKEIIKIIKDAIIDMESEGYINGIAFTPMKM